MQFEVWPQLKQKNYVSGGDSNPLGKWAVLREGHSLAIEKYGEYAARGAFIIG